MGRREWLTDGSIVDVQFSTVVLSFLLVRSNGVSGGKVFPPLVPFGGPTHRVGILVFKGYPLRPVSGEDEQRASRRGQRSGDRGRTARHDGVDTRCDARCDALRDGFSAQGVKGPPWGR